MIEMLECRGLVNYQRKMAGAGCVALGISSRLAKVSLKVDADEVAQVIQDKILLSSIMDDISCLPRFY